MRIFGWQFKGGSGILHQECEGGGGVAPPAPRATRARGGRARGGWGQGGRVGLRIHTFSRMRGVGGGVVPVLMLAPWGWGKPKKNKKNEIGFKMDVVEALHTDFLH